MRSTQGFSFIELMAVVSIIGVLAAIAIPMYTDYLQRAKIAEGFILANAVSQNISEYYAYHGVLPQSNNSLDLPDASMLQGQYVSQIHIENGAIHIQFSTDHVHINESENQLSLRPTLVEAMPMNIVSWICGYATTPTGLTVMGENKTSLPQNLLPMVCWET